MNFNITEFKNDVEKSCDELQKTNAEMNKYIIRVQTQADIKKDTNLSKLLDKINKTDTIQTQLRNISSLFMCAINAMQMLIQANDENTERIITQNTEMVKLMSAFKETFENTRNKYSEILLEHIDIFVDELYETYKQQKR